MTRSHETATELSGGGLCGAIRHRCTAQPCDVHYCHCHPEAVQPEMHWGIESQVSWLSVDDGLPRKSIEGDPEYMATRQTD